MPETFESDDTSTAVVVTARRGEVPLSTDQEPEGRASSGAAEDGVVLCLSGGGYRAMLFHLGSVWRLNEAGWLARLDRVSSVSGGSITAAALASAWSRLDFDGAGVGRAFDRLVVKPVRGLAGRSIDWKAILAGLLLPGTISSRVASAYRRHLLGRRTLADLPDRPRFVFNATNLQSGALFRMSKPYARDWRVGKLERPRLELATVVAASSAFPPFLSPAVLRFEESAWKRGSGADLQRAPYTTRLVLSDGGVYDNLGLETAWKRYSTVLVSDAGGKMGPKERPPRTWGRQTKRVFDVIDNQVRSLRKRQVVASYVSGARDGAYWGIRSEIANYGLTDALACPSEATRALADVPTRLVATPRRLQERLVNWGYAVTDAAMRRHVDPGLDPGRFPYPEVGVG